MSTPLSDRPAGPKSPIPALPVWPVAHLMVGVLLVGAGLLQFSASRTVRGPIWEDMLGSGFSADQFAALFDDLLFIRYEAYGWLLFVAGLGAIALAFIPGRLTVVYHVAGWVLWAVICLVWAYNSQRYWGPLPLLRNSVEDMVQLSIDKHVHGLAIGVQGVGFWVICLGLPFASLYRRRRAREVPSWAR